MNDPIRSRAELVTWIESCVLGDLRTLLVGVDAYYASPTHAVQDGRPLGAANCLLVAGCCSGIDSRYGEVGLLIGGASVTERSTLADPSASYWTLTHRRLSRALGPKNPIRTWRPRATLQVTPPTCPS